MDFLDPKAKKRHKIRLFIGYALMGTVILTTSAILVFSAYGFDVDRKTGEVIQNGMVFVDSAPDGAEVVFNDKLQGYKTNNRFSLPSAQYSLKIQKQGYRDWNRSFQLDGAEVERFTYPMLIPLNLEPREIQAYNSAPSFSTNSPDRRWAIVSAGNSITEFTEYDLNNLEGADDNPQTKKITLPSNLFTQADGDHSLTLVEWSTDNKHFLVKHNFAGGYEFVIIARDQPNNSININKLLGQNPGSVVLRDKKYDEWYLYTKEGGILQSADTKKSIEQVATNVTAFKTHDSDTILYATRSSAEATSQMVKVKQGSDVYDIKEVPVSALFLDIAKYDGKWRVVVGVDAEKKTYVYTDPVNELQKKNDKKSIETTTVLRSTGPINWVGFSNNTRFIVAQSGQHFDVYDFEYKERFRYDIENKFDVNTKVEWIDGHRMSARSGEKAIIFDFDGSNKQELVNVSPVAPLIFDRDYTVLYTITKAKSDAAKQAIFATELRLEGDK